MAVGQQIDLRSGLALSLSAVSTTPAPTPTHLRGQRGIVSRRQAEALSHTSHHEFLGASVSIPLARAGRSARYEDGTQSAADVRAAKVEAAATEQNDQDDQKDNQVHGILPVSAECGVARRLHGTGNSQVIEVFAASFRNQFSLIPVVRHTAHSLRVPSRYGRERLPSRSPVDGSPWPLGAVRLSRRPPVIHFTCVATLLGSNSANTNICSKGRGRPDGKADSPSEQTRGSSRR